MDHQSRSIKLNVEGVSKTYRTGKRVVEAIASIDLQLRHGEFISLIGPSGCGKSSLFTIIAGLEEPTTGVVTLDGSPGVERKGRVGYMPQQPLLLPWRTVEENMLLGLDVRHVPRQESLQRAHDLLKRFGLYDFATHYPDTLSGGMQQRVAFLRTVLFNSDLLLLDEPFGALDALTRISLQTWLQEVLQSFHSSVLFITHDIREALLLSDHIVVLSARPARVEKIISLDLPHPRTQDIFTLDSVIEREKELLTLLMKDVQP